MQKRTRLADRALPHYSTAEEITNTLTHAVGLLFGIAALILCLPRCQGKIALAACVIYGSSMILLYATSSIYHGLKPCLGKKVLQIIDHCTIYSLIAGSYTPIVLTAIAPKYPLIGWGLFAAEWALAALATTLTAIDLKKYSVFSMICYIGMGWAVIIFWRQTLEVMTLPGFALLLSGGIAYTIGSILYGIGKKKKWMHSVFHIFVVLGATLQFLSVLLYAV